MYKIYHEFSEQAKIRTSEWAVPYTRPNGPPLAQLESSHLSGWDPGRDGTQLGLISQISRVPAGWQVGSAYPRPGDPDPIPTWVPAGGKLVV